VRDVNEVDDVSTHDAIQIVSNGTCRDEQQRGARESGATPPEQENTEQTDHRDRARDRQQRDPHAFGDGPKDVERDVGVLGVSEVQDAIDQVTWTFAFQLALRDVLRGVVTSDEKQERDDQEKTLGDKSHRGHKPRPRSAHSRVVLR
jgi:hypothetical protein